MVKRVNRNIKKPYVKKECFLCDCEDRIKTLSQFKQGEYAMCWFVAVLNNLFVSEGLSEIVKKYVDPTLFVSHCENPSVIANHIMNDVKGKSCVPQWLIFKGGQDQIKNASLTLRKFYEFFEEYINESSHQPDFFGSGDIIHGGFPSKIIIPYLFRLGYPLCLIKQVIYNIDLIYPKHKIDPRGLKINRLCHDYLKSLHITGNSIEIFILTLEQSRDSISYDIKNQRSMLYIGKYICYLLYDNSGQLYLIVYKLDCGFLLSNNNKSRMGHAISMLSCKNSGFIVNSFKNEDSIDALKSCSIYNYDWCKWIDNTYFYHKLLSTPEGPKCNMGAIINSSTAEKYIDPPKNNFLYNRNIGINSFIYVFNSYKINYLPPQLELHLDIPILKSLYDEILKPYLYLLFLNAADENINININFVGTTSMNMNMYANDILIQRGIIKNCMNVCCYKFIIDFHINISKFIDMLKDHLADDIMIIQGINNKNEFLIFIEYLRSDKITCGEIPTYFGGNKSKP